MAVTQRQVVNRAIFYSVSVPTLFCNQFSATFDVGSLGSGHFEIEYLHPYVRQLAVKNDTLKWVVAKNTRNKKIEGLLLI